MIEVAGGVYAERCLEPFWDDVFGSGGRAAAAIASATGGEGVRLHTYRAEGLTEGLENLTAVHGFEVTGPEIPGSGVAFDYAHSLADPRITPRPDAIECHRVFHVSADNVLRFGMLEGSARVDGRHVVYDPQSAFDPRPFRENGSTAENLALILNRLEGSKLTGADAPEEIVKILLQDGHADAVVLKLGSQGAIAADKDTTTVVPAYRSPTVWKIGSGDVFSAAFALHWALDGLPAHQAADLASRSVQGYVSSRALNLLPAHDLSAAELEPVRPSVGRIYIAAPFFNLGELWMVEEVRRLLLQMGLNVFSPLHDVGRGPAEAVAMQDLAGLDDCDVVLAVLNGSDVGTVFEVGYAIAKGKPVVALAQNVRAEDLKMPKGSGCVIVEDLVSAIYQAAWAIP